MAKLLECGDVVPDCEARVRGESEEEVLRLAAEHARTTHGLAELDAATVRKVRAAIRDAE